MLPLAGISAWTLAVLGAAALAIGFVGGMVGLVLGVVRYPIILGMDPAAVTGAVAAAGGASTSEVKEKKKVLVLGLRMVVTLP